VACQLRRIFRRIVVILLLVLLAACLLLAGFWLLETLISDSATRLAFQIRNETFFLHLSRESKRTFAHYPRVWPAGLWGDYWVGNHQYAARFSGKARPRHRPSLRRHDSESHQLPSELYEGSPRPHRPSPQRRTYACDFGKTRECDSADGAEMSAALQASTKRTGGCYFFDASPHCFIGPFRVAVGKRVRAACG